MKTIQKICFGLLFAAGLSGAGLFGETETAALNLEKARSLAVKNSKTLQKAGLSAEIARLDEKNSVLSLVPNPSLSAGLGLGYPNSSSLDAATTASFGLSVSQTVFDGGKFAAESTVLGIASKIADADLRSTYLSVLNEADSAYYAVLEAQASLDAAKSNLDAARTHLSLAEAQKESGVLSQAGLLEIQAEEAASETAYNQAKKSLSVARAKLASLTGLERITGLQAVDFKLYSDLMKRLTGLGDSEVDSLTEKLVEAARANNPSLLSSKLSEEKAKATVNLEKSAAVPTVKATWSHDIGFALTESPGIGTGSVSISATIPLDYWNVAVQVESAGLSAKQAGLDYQEGARSIELEIRSALYDTLSAARTVASSRKALDYAESNYRNNLELFKLSAISSSDLSDAEALVSSNRSTFIGASYEFLTNLSNLQILAGFDSENQLLMIVE